MPGSDEDCIVHYVVDGIGQFRPNQYALSKKHYKCRGVGAGNLSQIGKCVELASRKIDEIAGVRIIVEQVIADFATLTNA